ncbi:MAG: DUF1449 family protein [Burkholderiales bacterium]|nr:DUF1449 family protein [Burkholderiales bacterium]
MSIWQLLVSFPTAVPTVLLAILLIYWLLSIAGIVDMGDNLDVDVGHHDFEIGHHEIDAGHAATSEISTLAGYLVALGLGGVPFSIILTLLVFFTWLATALVHQYFLAFVPTQLLQILLGILTLVVAGALSIPICAKLIKPMRPLFVKHHARSNRSLVGLTCKILTQTVDEKFGRAEVSDNGASLNIRVWAKTPNTLTKNSSAVVLSYDENTQQYEVQVSPHSH